jgi:hypothetical protein
MSWTTLIQAEMKVSENNETGGTGVLSLYAE